MYKRQVEYLKPGEAKNFAIVDAAMNDLARPALYDAWHDIVAVSPRSVAPRDWDIVGPICESGDFLGRNPVSYTHLDVYKRQPQTFARDARVLIDAGFRLEKVTPIDQFLWSTHVELVGVFRR